MIEHFDKNYIDEAVRRKIIDDDKNAAHFKYVRRNWLSGKCPKINAYKIYFVLA